MIKKRHFNQSGRRHFFGKCKHVYVSTKENNFLFEVPVSVDKKLLNNGIF